MRIIIIASTSGSVLSQLLKIPYFQQKVELVVSDRECGAIDVSKNADVDVKVISAVNGADFSEKLVTEIDCENIDLFISFYTKLFREPFLSRVKNKLINLHPSILPASPGLDGFGDSIKSGSKFVGTTIHFVDEGIDTGTPIIQSAIPVDDRISITELRHKIFIDQCRTLLQVVKWFEDDRIEMNDNAVVEEAKYDKGIYSPKLDFQEAITFNVAIPNKENHNTSKNTLKNADTILDLRSGTNHPLSLKYSEIFQNVLISGQFEHGRSQPGFSLKGKSPFVIVAQKVIEYGIDKIGAIDVLESVLQEYYNLVQPKNAAEWIGIQNKDSKFFKSPPWASVFPWRARTLESYQNAYEKAAIKENIINGSKLTIKDGWLFCGPVTKEKCKVEASRIFNVLKAISENGYIRSDSPDGDVKATALVNESNEWRWLITAGNHRAAAASALGMTEIPIRVNLVIKREESKFWPRVLSGLYEHDEALVIFNNYFNGIVPKIAETWNSNRE